MFSFDTKREPEKCQRFRRAGSTNQGLLARDNPKEEVETQKTNAAPVGAIVLTFFVFLRFEVAMRQFAVPPKSSPFGRAVER